MTDGCPAESRQACCGTRQTGRTRSSCYSRFSTNQLTSSVKASGPAERGEACGTALTAHTDMPESVQRSREGEQKRQPKNTRITAGFVFIHTDNSERL
jgi:hypothetical protein